MISAHLISRSESGLTNIPQSHDILFRYTLDANMAVKVFLFITLLEVDYFIFKAVFLLQ